jgi:hypothetical protein
MLRKRVTRLAGGVCAATLAVFMLSTLPAHALPAGSSFTDAQIAAGRALLAYVPSAFRMSCTILPLNMVPRPVGIIADVDCLPNVTAIDEIEYTQFSTQAGVDAHYANLVSWKRDTPPAGCIGDSPYSIAGRPAGQVACTSDTVGTYIYYTYTPLLVVGTISQSGGTKGAPDIPALVDFSNKSAGPLTAPLEIPSLLTDAEATRAVAALRSHLPPAIAKHCTSNDVSPTPWMSAWLSCEKPSKGVFGTSYQMFRDDASYKNAFDPKRYAAFSEKKNSVCPDTGAWSVNGKRQGHWACWINDADITSLAWGVDSQRIVATANAPSGDGFTSAQFLHWFDTKGSVKP